MYKMFMSIHMAWSFLLQVLPVPYLSILVLDFQNIPVPSLIPGWLPRISEDQSDSRYFYLKKEKSMFWKKKGLKLRRKYAFTKSPFRFPRLWLSEFWFLDWDSETTQAWISIPILVPRRDSNRGSQNFRSDSREPRISEVLSSKPRWNWILCPILFKVAQAFWKMCQDFFSGFSFLCELR